MSRRCADCGQFAGEGHACPDDPPVEYGTCDVCGDDLTKDQARFCSRDCYSVSIQPEKGTCKRCGDPLQTGSTFCSTDCFEASQRERYRDSKPRCKRDGCDEPLDAGDTYCSRACFEKVQQERHRPADTSEDERSYIVTDEQVIFSVDNKMFRVSIDRFDAICADYSEYGGDLTQAETARKHGIPLPLMRRVLRAYQQYKASPPMMRERIAEAESLEPLVQEAVENVEYELLNKIERRKESKIRREWREMREQLRDERRHTEAAADIVDGLTIHVPESDDYRPSTDGIIAHVPTADVHIGLYVWGEEGFGDNYDTDIACERLVEHGSQAASWLAEKGGAKVVYRSDLGDLLHADEKGETERGTFVDLDTRLGRVWSMGLEAMVENVLAVHSEAERTVVKLQRGNHDGPDTIKFKHSLALALKDVDGVEVDVSPHPYSSFRVGETQHILDHGYRVSKRLAWKATAQAEGVARDFWEDFQGAKWHYTWMGHLHSREVGGELDHHEIVRLEALCEANDYETELRFRSRPAARLFELDARGREKSCRVLRTDDLTPGEASGAVDEAGAA